MFKIHPVNVFPNLKTNIELEARTGSVASPIVTPRGAP